MYKNFPHKTLLAIYDARRSGGGRYDVANHLEKNGYGKYTVKTIERIADHPENVKTYTDSGDYHPPNEKRSLPSPRKITLKDNDLNQYKFSHFQDDLNFLLKFFV